MFYRFLVYGCTLKVALAIWLLKKKLILDRPVNIHLTGCPKSCAQPSPAEITLLGTTIEYEGETVEGYRIYLGDDEQAFKQPLGEVIWTDLPSRIEPLLLRYRTD